MNISRGSIKCLNKRKNLKQKFSKFNNAIIIILLLIALFRVQECCAENINKIRKSVVKIFVVSQHPDFLAPWAPGFTNSSSGSGFIISGNRIVTNAHVPSNARFLSVEKEGDARKYEAKIKYIAHDCDLALLEVIDNSFFNNTEPLSFGNLPELDSFVNVIGYPIGGDRLSVTRGVVSRIDFQVYSHSGVDRHLTVQIDAAINPGNSGGPVIQNGKVIGVAFQGYNAMVAQNMGYIIPTPVIHRFLTDIEDGQYDFYVDLGIEHFPLINKGHRRALGLGPGDYGVMISKVFRAGSAYGSLEQGDVLLAIDDLPVYSDGNVIMDGNRVMLHEIVERKFKGDSVKVKILRHKKELEVEISLTSPWPYLMQANKHDVRPRYVLYGGLVFQPLSSSYLKASKTKNIIINYFYTYFLEKEIYIERPEIILISKILPDPATTYLGQFKHTIVDKINGQKIKRLTDVSKAFKTPAAFYIIDLLGDNPPIILKRQTVEEAHHRILQRYGIKQEEYLEGSIAPQS